MSELVANCPRCGAKEMTFDLVFQVPTDFEYDWQHYFEAFCICRKCLRPTIFVLAQTHPKYLDAVKNLPNYPKGVNDAVTVEGYIGLKDTAAQKPPDHLPGNIEAVFREGSACLSIGCFNAAGTMFRLCIDLATQGFLPEDDVQGLNAKKRRDLGLRLPWLFDNDLLPVGLRDLSTCIKDDGNDGAHRGTLDREEAEDIQDFTYVFLERIYTEPKKVELAEERRRERRKEAATE